MADELNGHALPVHHTKPYTNGLFFPVVCFIDVFDQSLTGRLYRDKGL